MLVFRYSMEREVVMSQNKQDPSVIARLQVGPDGTLKEVFDKAVAILDAAKDHEEGKPAEPKTEEGE